MYWKGDRVVSLCEKYIISFFCFSVGIGAAHLLSTFLSKTSIT